MSTGTGRLAAAFVATLLLARLANAGVLPEDRADVLFHSYDGGGVTIQGPSLLVRKRFAEKFSAAANYYVDKVSSASIDVVTTASPYEEERTQYSLGFDYLNDSWLMNIGLTKSDENDYSAETFSFGLSQDLFGDLTTVSLGYTLGDDVVGRRGDDSFSESVQRQHYRLGVTQILTRNALLGISFETITDEGFLNNPYRSVRYLDPGGQTYSYEPEVYPRTRTSDSIAVRLRYYLPYRAALHTELRNYSDSWDIGAQTFEVGYTHPLADGGWTIEAKLRAYSQNSASFYNDLYPYASSQNFLARDKELSSFSSQGVRVGATYDFLDGGWRFVARGSVSVFYDRIEFDYADFRDLTFTGGTPGEEPLYGFGANVFQVFVSFWL